MDPLKLLKDCLIKNKKIKWKGENLEFDNKYLLKIDMKTAWCPPDKTK